MNETGKTPGQAARDLQAERDHAEWLGWMEASAYLRERGRPGVADMIEDAERAARAAAAAAQGAQPAPRVPQLLGHPDDAAEEWLAETYEPDDSPIGVGYERSDMIDAYHAGSDWAREQIAKFGKDADGRWITLEPKPAPGLAMLQADLADYEAQLAKWPKCPAGCNCRIGIEDDPDRNECGCDGPCNGGERPAPELAAAVAESRRYLEALQVARSFLLDPGSSGRRRAIAAISKALEGK